MPELANEEQCANQRGSEEPEEQPLVPLQPQLNLHPLELLQVLFTSVSVRWQPAEWSLPEHDDRQAEYQLRCKYTVEYELQVQQVNIGPPTTSEPPEQLLQKVPAACTESGWRAVESLAGPVQDDVQVTGLRAGRFYAARIVATACACVDSEAVYFPALASEVLSFRTRPSSPGQMQAPALAQRARNALKLKWNPPDETGGEAITKYVLKVTPPPAGWEGPPPDEQGFCEAYEGDERSFKLARLGPGQRFSFKIRCSNCLGDGPWSLPSTFTTQASVPAQPDPPVQVASTKDTMSVQWQAPAENGAAITCYQLEVDDGQGGDFSLVYTGMDQHAVVRKLQSGLHYCFRVRAENSEGFSQWSPIQAATTAATVPSSPLKLQLMAVDRFSATLSWAPPSTDGGSEIQQYEVQMQPKTKYAAQAFGTSDWSAVFQGPAFAATIGFLQPGCQYLLRVAARNAVGLGSPSMHIQIATGPGVPLAPPMPTADCETRAMYISWQPPKHDGGSPIAKYKLDIRSSPSLALHASGLLNEKQSLAVPDKWLTIDNINFSGEPLYVAELLPGTTYEFKVAAVNGLGVSEFSPVGTATTLPAEPLPPPAPQLAWAHSSSLQLRWQEPYGQGSPVTKYKVSVASLGPISMSSSTGGSGSALGSSLSRSSSSSTAPVANGHADVGDRVEQPDDAASSSGGSAQDKLHWEQAYSGPDTNCEVKQLQPAHRYLLRVRAYNSQGGSAWSETLTAATAPAAPGPPGKLVAKSTASDSITVSWQPPEEDHGSPVSAFHLEMAPAAGSSNSSSSNWSGVWQGSGLSHTVSGLLPGRKYNWKLRAMNACGVGPWCTPVTAATLPAVPCAPAKPQLSQKTATSVKAKWSIPLEDNGAAVSGYTVQVRLLGPAAASSSQHEYDHQATAAAQQDWQQVYRGSELSHRVTGLQPDCQYEVRVAAVNAVGSGPWSQAMPWTTLLKPPPPPASLSAEVAAAGDDAQQASVSVSWQPAAAAPASAEAVGYEVEAAPPSGSVHAAVRSTVARLTGTSLSGLRPGLTYSVRVRSVGAGGTGHSAWSEAVSVAMPAAPESITGFEAGSEAGGAVAAVETGKRAGKPRGSKGAASKASPARADASAPVESRQRSGRPANSKLGHSSAANPRLRPKKKSWSSLMKQLRKQLTWTIIFGVLAVMALVWFIKSRVLGRKEL